MNRAPAVLLTAALCAGLLLGACSGDDDGGGPAASPTAVPSTAPAGPPPPVATATPSVAVSSAAPVPIGDTTQLTATGVTVGVDRVREVEAEAVPGEVAGQAVAVRLTVVNGADQPFDLTGLAVTASFGQAAVPGDNSSSAPSDELRGSLAPGATARGTYVFHVPEVGREGMVVEVSSSMSPTVLQFAAGD